MSDPTEWAIDTVTCVSCPACAFTFDAVHSDPDGGYSCPACAEVRLTAEVDRLRVEVQTVRGEAYARVGTLAAQRAAVLALCETADQSWRAAHGAAGTATVGVRAVREALGGGA